jgi:hypothetical protein
MLRYAQQLCYRQPGKTSCHGGGECPSARTCRLVVGTARTSADARRGVRAGTHQVAARSGWRRRHPLRTHGRPRPPVSSALRSRSALAERPLLRPLSPTTRLRRADGKASPDQHPVPGAGTRRRFDSDGTPRSTRRGGVVALENASWSISPVRAQADDTWSALGVLGRRRVLIDGLRATRWSRDRVVCRCIGHGPSGPPGRLGLDVQGGRASRRHVIRESCRRQVSPAHRPPRGDPGRQASSARARGPWGQRRRRPCR